MSKKSKKSKKEKVIKVSNPYKNPELFINREQSWIQFNKRVLNECKRKDRTLAERLKFLSITASNLDEFIMVRVGALHDLIANKIEGKDSSGLTPKEQLDMIRKLINNFSTLQHQEYTNLYTKVSLEKGKYFCSMDKLTDDDVKELEDKFDNFIRPLITVHVTGKKKEFPIIKSQIVHVAAFVRNKKANKNDKWELAVIQLPTSLGRIIEMNDGERRVRVEEIISKFLYKLLPKYEIGKVTNFRVLRNADMDFGMERDNELMEKLKKELKKRERGEVIRMEVPYESDKELVKRLRKELKCDADVVAETGTLDLRFVKDLVEYESSKESHEPITFEIKDYFEALKKEDIFISLPFNSFDNITNFLQQAVEDEKVVAIRQTLYRVEKNSKIIDLLCKAARSGKDVTVLVELKARFDEENNINWAYILEMAGCRVIYGVPGLKTHTKLLSVIRKENNELVYYTHIGTGNYNANTAKQYTDIGVITSEKEVGEDCTKLFNLFSGYSSNLVDLKAIIPAPFKLRKTILGLIDNEIENAEKGKRAEIKLKLNSLCDSKVISKLYEASEKGVKLTLLIRGICTMKPINDNITIRSIVDDYLEHSRMFYFENGGVNKVFIGSSDIMPRNLDRRVEILYETKGKVKEKVKELLDVYADDCTLVYIMRPDGSYNYTETGRNVQELVDDVSCNY